MTRIRVRDATASARIDAATGARAREAIDLVADRLADPRRVAELAGRERNREPIYGISTWAPVTLSNGLPGVAAFFAEAARRDPAWLAIAHRHLAAAAELMPTAPSRGLHAGPASILAAAQGAGWPGGHYGALRRRLATWVAGDQLRRLDDAQARGRRGETGVAWVDYDVIHGISGTLRLLLDSAADPDESSSDVEIAVDRSLRHLVALTEPIVRDGATVPGWWVPNHHQPVEQDRVEYPDGDFNLGMAHGAAGPLAVLSAAVRAGHEVDGQREAIARLAGWLISWMLEDEIGVYWPCRVSWHDEVGVRPCTAFTRSAWCYGAPGIASALHQAGSALDDATWRSTAVTALRDVLARDPAARRLDGPTVCHGDAGLLQIVTRVGRAEDDPLLLDGAADLVERVVATADPEHAFVFAHLVPNSPDGWRSATGYRALDIAGVLEGAAGVGSALLDAVAPTLDDAHATPIRAWDRCLALS